MTNIITAIANWIPQVVGRYLNEDNNPQNQGFGAQCWDTAANWSKYLGLPVISTNMTGMGRWRGWAGNMVDAFPQNSAIAAAYELLPPGATVLGGDILVWDDSNKAVYPKTHVAVGVRDHGNMLLCISQNSSASLPGNPYPQWTTGPTILQHLPRKGLLGIIRPRVGITPQGNTTPSKEDDIMPALTDDEQRELLLNVRKLVHGQDAEVEFDEGVNEKVDEIVENLRKTYWNSEEAKIRLQNTSPQEFAAAVPVDQAKLFLDALAARLEA